MVRSLDITRRYAEAKILQKNFVIPDLQTEFLHPEKKKHGRSPNISGKTLEQRLKSSLKKIQRMTIMGKESLGRRGMLTKYPGPLPYLAVLQKS